MSTRQLLLVPFLLVVNLLGCPRHDVPASSHAMEGAGAPDPMYNPLRIGEVYVVRMDYGTPLVSRVEIKGKDDDTVTVLTDVELSDNSKLEPYQTVIRQRPGPQDQKLAAFSSQTFLRNETLTVSGIAFVCSVVEEPSQIPMDTSNLPGCLLVRLNAHLHDLATGIIEDREREDFAQR